MRGDVVVIVGLLVPIRDLFIFDADNQALKPKVKDFVDINDPALKHLDLNACTLAGWGLYQPTQPVAQMAFHEIYVFIYIKKAIKPHGRDIGLCGTPKIEVAGLVELKSIFRAEIKETGLWKEFFDKKFESSFGIYPVLG